MRQIKKLLLIWGMAFSILCVAGCSKEGKESYKEQESYKELEHYNAQGSYSLEEQGTLPVYSGEAYVVLDDNDPNFTEEDKEGDPFEFYSSLDELGRCGVAEAKISKDLMPTEERQGIGQIKPSGWKTIKYDNVEGKYLYNRCHLIGFQLTGENANERNLITGTRYMNTEGMLPFENMVADYIKETGNQVLYRVTPIFEEENLVASGVQMEAESVEDGGEGIQFNVYVFNVQPGIQIDYTDGQSTQEEIVVDHSGETYILNTNTKKYHMPSCSSVESMKEANRQEYKGTKADLEQQGYEPCSRCQP